MKSRILLVDDEPAILFAYKKMLAGESMEIDGAHNKQSAYRMLGVSEYHLAILDLNLDGSSCEEGFELIEYIRDKHPGTTIIVITAHPGRDIRERAYRLGADRFIEKPVNISTLRSALLAAGFLLPPCPGQDLCAGVF